jgi:hypothetical protein
MRQRCTNPKASYYAIYGGSGITVTPEWDDYRTFREWALLHGYADHLTIERRNGTKNYEPNNCYWADNNTQAANKRKRDGQTSQFIGVAPNKKGWQSYVSFKGVRTHLGTYPTELEAAQARDTFIKQNSLPHKLNFEDTSCK